MVKISSIRLVYIFSMVTNIDIEILSSNSSPALGGIQRPMAETVKHWPVQTLLKRIWGSI